jgi:DNA-binding MarR family transcriptional regulator
VLTNMHRDTYQDVSQDGPRDGPGRDSIRLSVPQAAERIGVTQDAVRKRIKRGYIEWEKDADGRLFVWVDPTETGKETSSNTSSETSQDVDDTVLLDYVETLKDRIHHLEEESRRKDHLLAAALERIPAIEPPPDTPTTNIPPETSGGPVTPSEHQGNGSVRTDEETSEKPSWWKRFLGVE